MIEIFIYYLFFIIIIYKNMTKPM